MSAIYEEVGRRIRNFRTSLKGVGISQEDLAEAIGTNANTVSRWETAVYKPTLDDLESLANFFNVPITYLLPSTEVNQRLKTLLSAVYELPDEDLEEVIRYALFRRAMAPVTL